MALDGYTLITFKSINMSKKRLFPSYNDSYTPEGIERDEPLKPIKTFKPLKPSMFYIHNKQYYVITNETAEYIEIKKLKPNSAGWKRCIKIYKEII